MPEYETRILVCCECGEEFVFTVAAQEYFAEKGYTEDPKRCKACHTWFKKEQRTRHLHPNTHGREAPL